MRAMYLLLGGLLGVHACAVPVLIACAWLRGKGGCVAALLALAVVIFCFGVGQAVQVGLAESAPPVVLAGSLASYAVRMGLLGLMLWAMRNHAQQLHLHTRVFFFSVVVLTVGWFLGEVMTFMRLRFPVYDTEYLSPEELQRGGLS
ncbi:MAG: hypothetical protein ACRCWS_06060 [Propionibacteriaceae bacterium]